MASKFTTKKQQGIQYSKTVQIEIPYGVTTSLPASVKAFKCQPSNVTFLRLYFTNFDEVNNVDALDVIVDGTDDGVIFPFRPNAILTFGGNGALNVELLF